MESIERRVRREARAMTRREVVTKALVGQRFEHACALTNGGPQMKRYANATRQIPVGSPLIATYSIVALDPATGELGVAVESHYFAAGAVVPWVEPHVGAVATQAFAEPGYGMRGLSLMRAGKSAPEALSELLAADRGDRRQVAMIDAQGRVAAHTGARTVACAGHIIGENFSVQGNMLLSEKAWPAMAKAFQETRGDLAERMLAALDAAEAEGGDIRGKQAAGLVVASGEEHAHPWDRALDIRVDDSPEPLPELHRLLHLARANRHGAAARTAFELRDFEAAGRELAAARAYAPESIEEMYWWAVAMVSAGGIEESIAVFREVFARNRNWAILLTRLPKAGMFPDDPALIERILKAAGAK